QPSIAGTLHGNAFPTAPSGAAANRARSSGTGGHAQGHYGPVFSRTSGGRGTGRGGGGPAGGAGRGGGPEAVLSANEKAVIRAQRAAQHQALQDQQLATPGNPQNP
ncbi:unnamed protein product, partial [Pylaiella littoralis]